jgi:DNA-binding FadR family transcriptional regulator
MSEPGSLIRALSGRPSARNYHSYVIAEIGVGIASGRFAVGAILPNDAEMMDRYGVSRTVLREALKTLEAKGLVEARAKVGTRVLPRSRWNLFDRQVLAWVFEAGPDAALLRAFAEIRAPLELQAAEAAARGRTAEHIRIMTYWLNQRIATAALPEPHAMAEFELHRTVFEASQNPFLRAATGISEFAVVCVLRAREAAQAGNLAAGKSGAYQALLAAIEAGDPLAARRAMQAVIDKDNAWLAPGGPDAAD